MEKILIADDEAGIRGLFKKALTNEGYDVLLAADGQDAVTLVKEEKPHLVLLDLKMPVVDGLQALRRIKELDTRILVIMMSGYGNIRTVIDALKLGVYDYLPKPLSLNKATSIIRQALETQYWKDKVRKNKS